MPTAVIRSQNPEPTGWVYVKLLFQNPKNFFKKTVVNYPISGRSIFVSFMIIFDALKQLPHPSVITQPIGSNRRDIHWLLSFTSAFSKCHLCQVSVCDDSDCTVEMMIIAVDIVELNTSHTRRWISSYPQISPIAFGKEFAAGWKMPDKS